MSKSIEEIFTATQTKIRAQMIDAVEAAIEGVYAEYLPHVENDNYFNVRQCARDWLIRLMSDSLRDEDIKLWEITSDFTGQGIRAKIFQDNKEELTKLIGQDIVDRVKDLEERIAQHWERYYG